MDELIARISQRLGVEEEQLRKALGAVLAFLKDQVANKNFDFRKILESLQGAEQLMKDSEATTAKVAGKGSSTGGYTGIAGLLYMLLHTFGVFDVFKKLISTFFGENAMQMIDTLQDGAELSAVLNKLGIDNEKGVKIVTMLVEFMKEKISPETVEQLSDKVPALKAFLRVNKKEE